MPIPKDMIGGMNKNLVGFLFESVVTNKVKGVFSSKSDVDITRQMYNDRFGNSDPVDGVSFQYENMGGVKALVCVPNRFTDFEKITETVERPVLIYLHGGGWCYFNTFCFNQFLQHISDLMGVVVIAPEYKLAPENKFPAGLDDCYAVINHVMLERKLSTFPELQLDVENRLMIGGDSAGGNLTAACIIKLAKDDAEHIVRPLAALPIYPVLQSVTNMIPSMRYDTPMASSTATSMIDLTNKYGNLGCDGKRDQKKLFADTENTDQDGHPMYHLFKRMDPEKYLPRVDPRLFSGHMDQTDVYIPSSLEDEHYLKAKRGNREKYTEHPQLYAYMANELVSPLAASDETFKLLVGEKGPKFVYVMGSQYCGLRDEGLIYIERLKENEETVHKRGRFFASTAARTIHGWINGSTSYGNGEPEPTGSDKMSMARREWDALLREWVDRVKCDILAKWDD